MPSRRPRTANRDLEFSLYPVIMAGGSGTRFWPLSRHLFPKQLLRIGGEQTLIQQTMQRVSGCANPSHVLISTNAAQAELIKGQLTDWKDDLKDNFVLEPEGRNTAPAIALAAIEILARDPEALMLVVPADHVVTGQRDFEAAVKLASELAADGYLVTFGIEPIRPETGYGYIKNGKRLGAKDSAYAVQRFVEKPNLATATKYVSSCCYLWKVVATAVGGIREVVVHGETGFLVPVSQQAAPSFEPVRPDEFARDLARSIDALLADPALRRRMGVSGRRRVEDRFSWRAVAGKTLGLYRSLLLGDTPTHQPGGA